MIEGMVIQVLEPNRVVISAGTADGVTTDMLFAVRFERSPDSPEKCRLEVILPGRNQTVCEATEKPLPNIVVPGDYIHEVSADPPVLDAVLAD